MRPRPGSGCCVQRIPVAGQGWPLHVLRWCPAQGGMLAATGGERSVVMLETKKWVWGAGGGSRGDQQLTERAGR